MKFWIDRAQAVSYRSTMLYLAKMGFVIAFLTAGAAWLLQMAAGRQAQPVRHVVTSATIGSVSILLLSQIWVAIFGIVAVTLVWAKRRIYAAGLAIFLIITMPGIETVLNVGGVQLIDLSIITAVIIGLMLATAMWKGSFSSAGRTNNYTPYAFFCVVTFIAARDTTITNILRVILENLIAFIVPYMIVRNSLRDSLSIRTMTMCVIAAGLAVSAIAMFESFMVWPIYQSYGQSFGTLVNAGVKMRGGMLRAAGPSMNPPLSAAVLALCFVTAFASASLFRTKAGHRVVLGIIAVGLFCMQARVGWLGAIAGSVGVLISRRGVKAIATYVPIVILAFGGVYGLAQVNEGFANLAGFSADAKGSSDYRDRANARSIEIIKQHPLLGQPANVVISQMEDLRQGEGIVDFVNGYMATALFSGLLGLGIFVSGLLYQAYNSYSGRRLALSRGARSLADLGFGVAVSAIVMFPFVPTDYRVLLVAMLLFTLSNAVITHSHLGSGIVSHSGRMRRNLIAESGQRVGEVARPA